MSSSRRRILGLALGTAAGLLANSRLKSVWNDAALAWPDLNGATGLSPLASIGPVLLNVGLVVITAQHNGTGRVTADLLPPSGSGSTSGSAGRPAPFPIFDRAGPFKAAAATLIRVAGSYYAEVSAPDPCSLTFQQPVPESVVAVQQSKFSGSGKDVSPYFMLTASVSSLSVQTTSATLRAWLYHLDDSGGEAVQGGVTGADGRFFDLGASHALSTYSVSLPDAGPYLLAVDLVTPGDTWSFTFS